MTPESMDAIFAALAHAGRRRILDILKERPGSTVGEVCASFATSRIAALKNLKVLEEAGLVASERVGRTRRLFLNAVPIQMIYERWMTQYSALWAERLTSIKYRVEHADAGAGPVIRNTKRRKKELHDG